jgi:hypothetical protein
MQVASCHLLAVLFITLGSEAQDAYDTLLPVLQVRELFIHHSAQNITLLFLLQLLFCEEFLATL